MAATDIVFSTQSITAMKLNLMVKELNAAIASVGGGGGTVSGTLIYGEVPAGTVNGANKAFTTASAYRANLLSVFLNGVRQRRTNDYTETSNNSFSFVAAPVSGDILSVDYMQAGFGSPVSAFGSHTPATSGAGPYTLGNTLKFPAAGQITALKYYRASSTAASHLLRLWDNSTTAQVASAVTSGETGVGWITATLATPYQVSANQVLCSTVDEVAGDSYCYETAPISTDTAEITWVGGCYTTTIGAFPATLDTSHHYFGDVIFEPAL
jgi:hypothetical protein